MAQSSSPAKAGKQRSRGSEDPNYDAWFAATPDPWSEVAKLTDGGDRTHATTVERLVLNAEPAQRSAVEAKLLAVLENAQTDAARFFVARMLGLVGSPKAVPALAKFLGDPKTADAARYALDRIADASVDEAYRAALSRLTGPAKAGLIGSIALRGDAAALPELAAIEQNPAEPPATRELAGRAIKRLKNL